MKKHKTKIGGCHGCGGGWRSYQGGVVGQQGIGRGGQGMITEGDTKDAVASNIK